MADIMSPEKRSRLMSRIRYKNTKPECVVFDALECAGACFKRHEDSLPGKPDIVFPSEKVAVFIDGDFWHGWYFPRWQDKLSPWWRTKIANNRRRDRRNHQRLRRKGWRVIRIWEHEVKDNSQRVCRKILSLVQHSQDREEA